MTGRILDTSGQVPGLKGVKIMMAGTWPVKPVHFPDENIQMTMPES